MIKRRDLISVLKQVDETVITESSVTRNIYSVSVLGVRQLIGGCWFVSSCVNCSDIAKLSAELESIIKTSELERCTVPENFEVEFYSGRLSLGSRESSSHTPNSVMALLRESELSGLNHVVIVRNLRILRSIEAEDFTEGFEEKNLVEVWVNIRHRERTSRGISVGRVFPQGLGRSVESVSEELLKLAVHRARTLNAAKRPSLTEIGKAEVILLRDSSPAFFRELSYLLSGFNRLLGKRLFDHSSVRISDSPGELRRPSARFFDDEGVIARRRWLVEGGVVVDAYHTIRTAYEAGSYPGSAHGLLSEMRPFHTSLVVESGDWEDSELLEETKRGFVVDGVATASLEEGYVRLVPQSALRIERGDLGEPVYIKAVKVPLVKPIKVLGLGKAGYTAFSVGPGGNLVSETSPPIKVEAFIEV